MIYIDQIDAQALETYKKTQSVVLTAQEIGVTQKEVARRLKNLRVKGLLRRSVSGSRKDEPYTPTNEPYGVVEREKMWSRREVHEYPVEMTTAEKRWMIDNYNPRNRQRACEALGRTRTDINFMALQLKIDGERVAVKCQA